MKFFEILCVEILFGQQRTQTTTSVKITPTCTMSNTSTEAVLAKVEDELEDLKNELNICKYVAIAQGLKLSIGAKQVGSESWHECFGKTLEEELNKISHLQLYILTRK